MKRRIIIPAAGDAVRFGGIPKELLPISETDCALTHAVRLAQSFEAEALVVTNPRKKELHQSVLERSGLPVEICVRQNWKHKDLWGSIELGLSANMQAGFESGGLILPDTVAETSSISIPVYDSSLGNPAHPGGTAILFGVFTTLETERFSVVVPYVGDSKRVRIATKEKLPGDGLAWGMILWNKNAADFMLGLEVGHYDRAFEAAARQFNWGMFKLASYHDLGSFKSYREFLESL
jgi:hypothetical protein